MTPPNERGSSGMECNTDAMRYAKPTKVLPDYALFITEQPGLELALDLRASVAQTKDAHFGVFVDSVDEVERAIARLEASGLAESIEREDTCCYANQTKV